MDCKYFNYHSSNSNSLLDHFPDFPIIESAKVIVFNCDRSVDWKFLFLFAFSNCKFCFSFELLLLNECLSFFIDHQVFQKSWIGTFEWRYDWNKSTVSSFMDFFLIVWIGAFKSCVHLTQGRRGITTKTERWRERKRDNERERQKENEMAREGEIGIRFSIRLIPNLQAQKTASHISPSPFNIQLNSNLPEAMKSSLENKFPQLIKPQKKLFLISAIGFMEIEHFLNMFPTTDNRIRNRLKMRGKYFQYEQNKQEISIIFSH